MPDAFKIGKNFIGRENVALILGDNFFYGQSLSEKLKKITKIFITNLFIKYSHLLMQCLGIKPVEKM